MAERRLSRPDLEEQPEGNALDHVLKEFLDEWKDDRREGRTMKVLHRDVKELSGKLDAHILTTESRVSALETDAKRDAEDRTRGGGGSPGRYALVQPKRESDPPMRHPDTKLPQSWWAREPLKSAVGYGAAALVAGTIGVATGHQIAVPTPSAVEELPHPVPPQPPPPIEIPVATAAATAVATSPATSADAGPKRAR